MNSQSAIEMKNKIITFNAINILHHFEMRSFKMRQKLSTER